MLAIFFSGFVLFVSCTEKEPAPEFDKALLLQLVNSHRAAGCDCGSEGYFASAAPVVWNVALERAARDHSEDMFAKNFFSHTGSDGSTVASRLERHKYNWKSYGENIGRGYQTEKSVIEGWMKSAGHCRNIMNPSLNEMGASRKGNYWTLILGTR